LIKTNITETVSGYLVTEDMYSSDQKHK